MHAVSTTAIRWTETKGIEFISAANLTISARSRNEALGWGLEVAKEQFPESEGWYNHGAAVAQISLTEEDQIIMADAIHKLQKTDKELAVKLTVLMNKLI